MSGNPQDQQLQDAIYTIIRTLVGRDIDQDTLLLENKLIDSITMINVLLALEEKFGIRINPMDLTFDHFQSCRTLSTAIAGKLNAG